MNSTTFLDNKEEFQTVWQLSHNWIGADPDKTDANAVPLEFKNVIHRLVHAMASGEISVRSHSGLFFEDDSFLSLMLDFFHYLRFFQCLRKNKFNKAYLDNLYVKRNEVINWCNNIAYLDLPPCWILKEVASLEGINNDADDSDQSWHQKLTINRRKKVACLEIAIKLWEEDPNQTYEEIHNHPMMKQYGNPSVFSPDSFQKWSKEFSSEFAKKGGRRKKSEG